MTAAPLIGNRQFTWFKAAGRRPTQYEAYTVGQQSGPEQWLHVDWPLRFDDGRAPWAADSTKLKCANWGDFRDPTGTWQRPYVAQHNQQEQAIAALVPEVLRGGLAESMQPAWRDRIIGTYYAAWPFVEYGEFLCLCYAVREALADTITFSLAFELSDKLRHSQDIVHYLLTLSEVFPEFSDQHARDAWMKDPALVPLRETIEHIHGLNDWAETAVAINLVLEPLAGDLFKSELLARLAPLNGDAVTPMILASARQDTERHRASAKALVRLATADEAHGAENRATLREWIARWTPPARAAAAAFAPIFELERVHSTAFAPALSRVQAQQVQLVEELGIAAGRIE